MKESKKTKGFKLLDIAGDGKGISKSAADVGYGLKGFFVSYKNNFNKILYVNIFMVLGNFPMLFLIAAFSGVSQADAYLPMHDIFQNLSGFFATEPNTPLTMTLYALEGIQYQVLVPTAWTYVMYGIGALTLFTFGCVNAGCAYILRNIAMHEPVFAWSDFWYAVKRNWKQALPFGVVDILIHAVLAFNIYTMLTSSSGFFTDLFFWSNIVIFFVYFVMRYYIYIQLVTCEMSIGKIIKNSLYLTALGFKRNIVGLLGAILFAVFLLYAYIILPQFTILLLCIFVFSFLTYLGVYCSYTIIKRYVIDPYYDEHPDEHPEDPWSTDERVFVDRG